LQIFNKVSDRTHWKRFASWFAQLAGHACRVTQACAGSGYRSGHAACRCCSCAAGGGSKVASGLLDHETNGHRFALNVRW